MRRICFSTFVSLGTLFTCATLLASNLVELTPGRTKKVVFRDMKRIGALRPGDKEYRFLRTEKIVVTEFTASSLAPTGRGTPGKSKNRRRRGPRKPTAVERLREIHVKRTPTGVSFRADAAAAGATVWRVRYTSVHSTRVWCGRPRRIGVWKRGRNRRETHVATIVVLLPKVMPTRSLAATTGLDIQLAGRAVIAKAKTSSSKLRVEFQRGGNTLRLVAGETPGKAAVRIEYQLNGKRYKTKIPVVISAPGH